MRVATGPLVAVIAVAWLGGALSGCASSSTPSVPVSAQLNGASSSSPGQIVLSATGAQRIGLQVVRAQAVPRPATIRKTTLVAGVKRTTTTHPAAPRGSPTVIVPFSALIYDPSGQVYLFTNTAPLTYVEVPITVDRISGNSAYLVKGPTAGTAVVSVGAEELYGVQSGVLAQT